MYIACRHIKTNGIRCQSPALRGHAFCYFHAKLHSSTSNSVMADIELPVPEDVASIQLSLARVQQALLSSRIDAKRAAQLLWSLQIASQNVPRKWIAPVESVESLTQTEEGDELAPELRVCNGFDVCEGCTHAETCPNYSPDDDDDDDEEEIDPKLLLAALRTT